VTTAEDEGAVTIRDACPSVHVPFAQVDGALVRIRVPGGTLGSGQLRHIAEAASTYGTALEITSRANLQIRGVTAGGQPRLVEDLVAAGVTLADGAADARRNVLASPTAGLDPDEVVDTRALIGAVTDSLVRADGAALSPKFGVLVDGGGAVHVRGRRQDICLGAVRLRDGSWGYEVRLGQPLPDPDAHPITVARPTDAADLVRGLLDLMLEHPEAGGRMSGLVALLGTDEVLRLVAARHDLHLFEVAPGARGSVSAPSRRPIGELAQRGLAHVMVGAMPVLGRLSGQQLDALADVAEDFGAGRGEAEVRVTPWRSVLIPHIARERAATARRALALLGLVVDATDPALSVVACAGSTGCASSFTDTQRDARVVVEALRSSMRPAGFTVHLSGCAKRCADRTTDFDVTMVGGPTAGVYEAVARRDTGESGLRAPGALDPEAALVAILSAAASDAT
jgi:precorrin-3B synthase